MSRMSTAIGHGTFFRALWRAGAFSLALLAMLCVWACEAKKNYPQSSPDDVIKAAVGMVKNGETAKLPDLIYAEGPEMRFVLNQLGKLLQSMQELSKASAARFPEEFAKLQADAMAAASDPKNKSLVAQIMVGLDGAGQSSTRQPSGDEVRAAFSALLADPYGWIDRNASRLSTVKTSDETASVLFDGQPAIPVIGLPLKMDKNRWYVYLPITTPPLSNVMPRSRQQWSILASVIKVVDNAVIDLTADVQRGNVASLKNLVDKFQDKVLFPVAIAFAAYGKELDVRGRVDRRLSAFRTRQKAWVDERNKAAPEGTPGVSPKLLSAIGAVAPASVEKMVRANKPFGVDKMSGAEFEDLVSQWLKDAGLNIRMDGDLFGESIDQAIVTWEEQRKAASQSGQATKPRKP